MSYAIQESSQAGGSPAEAYLFSLGGTVFRYTSQKLALTIAPDIYEPLEITRSNPKQNKERSGTQLTITLPADANVPRKYLSIVPTQRMSLSILRLHRTDTPTPQVTTYWKGFVTGCKFKDQVAELTCEPLQSLFAREFPRRVFSSLCNNILYDAACGVNRASFSDNVLVTSFSGDTLVLNSLSAARPADTAFFTGGFVERANGDKRLILSYTFATDTVRILLPFEDLELGELVTARAGCARDLSTCLNKFNNVIKNGGYPTIPTLNPFDTGL